MAIIKCKMCGGDLVLVEGSTVATCEFCGSQQTVPTADNEKKLTLFARANRLRAACDFDKAAGIYESIVADFSDEAEAYWGLVLCKYGIEYVDDPGTGKKIPTCHRSSFDSVMDDANFEQAMENAHMEAQKVYRDEAKQFERIRKGILEVSSTEKPYDIFICYKETAPNGDRTLDSVLAQDLYSALTDKGYRVFFSRITLQGKLGEAFEPYIFAALNSAKVMLAVGTSYEYYNAVWVKNEWSRYLKICEADKSKHLIPCYKDLDPEDMPKEFNHLQGADLGKMGAIQDILFNMAKYIPLKKQNTTVIQERVVVGGSGNNKIASLLDRGNMALEDGDWAKADSFFEDVLNNDSKNAQAYLGKTLAMEKCRTIDAFARKRKDATQNITSERLYIKVKTHHIDEMVVKYTLPTYLDADRIRNLYDFDLGYPSDAPGRQQQYRNEEKYWADHKWLSKAEKFAVGAVAEHLETEKKALFSALAQRVKQAEAAEAAAKKDVQARYDAHLLRADEKAEALFEDGRKRREADYQKLLMLAKNSADVAELTEAAGKFDDLGDYQDSKNLAGHCRNRAKEEQAKLDAEEERQRIQAAEKAAKQAAARKRKKALTFALAVLVIVAALAGGWFAFSSAYTADCMEVYNAGVEAYQTGDYYTAIDCFAELVSLPGIPKVSGIEDSREMLIDSITTLAVQKIENSEGIATAELAEKLPGSAEEKEKLLFAAYYEAAVERMAKREYAAALRLFYAISDYDDEAQRIKECHYLAAEEYLLTENYGEAAYNFDKAEDFSDAKTRAVDAHYLNGLTQLEYGWFGTAYNELVELGDYKDSAMLVKYCQMYSMVQTDLLSAEEILAELPEDYGDVAKIKAEIELLKPYVGTYSCNSYSSYMMEYGVAKKINESRQQYYSLDICAKYVQLDTNSPELTPQVWIRGLNDRNAEKQVWIIDDLSYFGKNFEFTFIRDEDDGMPTVWDDFTFTNGTIKIESHEDKSNTTYDEVRCYTFKIAE